MLFGLLDQLREYWKEYGGIGRFFGGPISLIALVLTAAMVPIWWIAEWWHHPISIIPNLLGFSLGGYAILLAFGDSDFMMKLNNLHPEEGRPNAYLTVSNTFAHFILMQVVALIYAFLLDAWHFPLESVPLIYETLTEAGALVGWSAKAIVFVLHIVTAAFGFWLFLYALLLIVPATLWLLDLSRLQSINMKQLSESNKNSPGE